MQSAKLWLKEAIIEYAPGLWVARRLQKRPGSAEPELALIPHLAQPNWIAADVGANYGLYTRLLEKHCKKVHAFEPGREMAHVLRRTVGKNVVVHENAVSDKSGFAEFHIPKKSSQAVFSLASLDAVHLSSLHSARLDNEIETRRVSLVSLDEALNEPINFIKIDVEGHEMNVLTGAKRVISESRPIFLVEAEQQHRENAPSTVFEFFRGQNYRGYFLRNGSPVSIAEFDPVRDQDPSVLHEDGGRAEGTYYANNFFFLPDGSVEAAFLQAARRAGG